MPSPPGWSFTGKRRKQIRLKPDSTSPAARRDEFRPVVTRRQPRRELESKCRDLTDAAGVDFLPVVARAVIVRVEAGEEINRRHAPGDERRIVAAPCTGTFAPHAQLIAAGDACLPKVTLH